MFFMNSLSRKRTASHAPNFCKAGEQMGLCSAGPFMPLELGQGFIDDGSSHAESPIVGLDFIIAGEVGQREAMRKALNPQLAPTRLGVDPETSLRYPFAGHDLI